VEDEILKLPLPERAARYRAQAAKALAEAERCKDTWARDTFLVVAEQWQRLADQCARFRIE
jgi:hypothetical protein